MMFLKVTQAGSPAGMPNVQDYEFGRNRKSMGIRNFRFYDFLVDLELGGSLQGQIFDAK
jgi:hypothetical protein